MKKTSKLRWSLALLFIASWSASALASRSSRVAEPASGFEEASLPWVGYCGDGVCDPLRENIQKCPRDCILP